MLAERLERLLQAPLSSVSDVEPWWDACDEVRTWIYAHRSELPFRLPPYVMFYFHDPDIRVKDPEYKEAQEEQIRRLIRQLRGEEPRDVARPWWKFW